MDKFSRSYVITSVTWAGLLQLFFAYDCLFGPTG